MTTPGGFAFIAPVDAYAETAAVRDASNAGDWDRVVTLLDKLPGDGDRGWVLRAVTASAPHRMPPVGDIRTAAGQTLAVFLAHCLVQQAWNARSAAKAADVSAAQFERFRALLVRAERQLVEVVAVAPSRADAWDLRIATSRGLELGRSESQRRYARLNESVTDHVPAQRAMLQELCPKWHGDWETAFTLVRSVAEAATPGSLGPMLVVDAHLEGWAEHGADYLRQPSVVEEVLAAANTSVLHADFVPVVGWREAHGNLALFFSLAEMPDHAAFHFHALGDHPVEGTWGYFDQPEAQYERRRTEAFAAGARR